MLLHSPPGLIQAVLHGMTDPREALQLRGVEAEEVRLGRGFDDQGVREIAHRHAPHGFWMPARDASSFAISLGTGFELCPAPPPFPPLSLSLPQVSDSPGNVVSPRPKLTSTHHLFRGGVAPSGGKD